MRCSRPTLRMLMATVNGTPRSRRGINDQQLNMGSFPRIINPSQTTVKSTRLLPVLPRHRPTPPPHPRHFHATKHTHPANRLSLAPGPTLLEPLAPISKQETQLEKVKAESL